MLFASEKSLSGVQKSSRMLLFVSEAARREVSSMRTSQISQGAPLKKKRNLCGSFSFFKTYFDNENRLGVQENDKDVVFYLHVARRAP